MPKLLQALFVYYLLDGVAKREIKKIFELLKNYFRCSKSLNALYHQFYHRWQFEGVSVFPHANGVYRTNTRPG